MAMAIIPTIIVFVFCVTKNYDILISFIKVYVSLCHLISIRIIVILSILKNQYKVDLPIFSLFMQITLAHWYSMLKILQWSCILSVT